MAPKTIREADVEKARAELKVLSVERDIASAAVTTIYEAEAKGVLTEKEKNELVPRYKQDLKRVESEISERQKVIDLYELEKAKAELMNAFKEKLGEIEDKINELKSSVGPSVNVVIGEGEKKQTEGGEKKETDEVKETSKKEDGRTKAEKRLEDIREEVLRAMERLEQIESEG